jgi:hypothetical protein
MLYSCSSRCDMLTTSKDYMCGCTLSFYNTILIACRCLVFNINVMSMLMYNINLNHLGSSNGFVLHYTTLLYMIAAMSLNWLYNYTSTVF